VRSQPRERRNLATSRYFCGVVITLFQPSLDVECQGGMEVVEGLGSPALWREVVEPDGRPPAEARPPAVRADIRRVEAGR